MHPEAQTIVRQYEEKDLAALRAIHAVQGFEYALPDLSNPLFITKLVLTERASTGEEKICGAALLRLTAEAYLLLDPGAGAPRERWQRIRGLQDAAARDAWARGLEDVHAWLPPPISEKFGKHIERLGWIRDDVWTPYCIRLAENRK
jgi:hypothetical protein